MEPAVIAELIQAGLPGAEVKVTGDGRYFEAVVISDQFAGKSLVQRQRLVMNTVRAQIESGALHALSIKTLLPDTVDGGSGAP